MYMEHLQISHSPVTYREKVFQTAPKGKTFIRSQPVSSSSPGWGSSIFSHQELQIHGQSLCRGPDPAGGSLPLSPVFPLLPQLSFPLYEKKWQMGGKPWGGWHIDEANSFGWKGRALWA